ncbi:uncharacterized protein LOC127001429 [Eriocheir sinensis]|uniref:uncharacterized protein LOC127001429 n=1 Tax=Eriocheir sinensis TaxID=95602 RepID=UPI0021C86910|nr:uncharacterized protein LOC127001429 [Eriocheir sinensis]
MRAVPAPAPSSRSAHRLLRLLHPAPTLPGASQATRGAPRGPPQSAPPPATVRTRHASTPHDSGSRSPAPQAPDRPRRTAAWRFLPERSLLPLAICLLASMAGMAAQHGQLSSGRSARHLTAHTLTAISGAHTGLTFPLLFTYPTPTPPTPPPTTHHRAGRWHHGHQDNHTPHHHSTRGHTHSPGEEEEGGAQNTLKKRNEGGSCSFTTQQSTASFNRQNS